MNWDEYVETALKLLSSASKIPEATVLEKEDNRYFPTDSLPPTLPKYLDSVKENFYSLNGGGNSELRFRLPEKTKILSLDGNLKKGEKTCTHRQQVVLQFIEIDGDAYIFLRGYGNKEFNRYAVSIYRVSDQSLITPHYLYDIFPYYKKYIEDKVMNNLIKEIYNSNSISSDSELAKFNKEQKVFLYFCVHLFNAEDSGFFSRMVPKVGLDALNQGDTADSAYQKLKKYQSSEYRNLAELDLVELKRLNDEQYNISGDVDDAYSPVINRLYSMEFTELKRLYVRLFYKLKLHQTSKLENISDYQVAYEKTYELVRVYFGSDSLS